MGDQDLVLCSINKLNKLLKKHGISKERAREIKERRRTLLNRSYAMKYHQLLKKHGISKERAREIKARRRTLLNRSYAMKCHQRSMT